MLAENITCCVDLWSRLRGLLGTKKLDPSQGCWLNQCNSIHTIGMHYPIDAYFLNKKNVIVKIIRNLKPNRISSLCWSAYSVLELCTDPLRLCRIGDKLVFEASS